MRKKPYIYFYQDKEKWHGIFAIQINSCLIDKKERDEVSNWPLKELKEQENFINSLFCPTPPRAYAIRYIFTPHPKYFSAGKVEVFFLARIEGQTKEDTKNKAEQLCDELVALLGGTKPSYIWNIVKDKNVFTHLFNPLNWENAYIAEIRRREERVFLETLKPRPHLGRGSTAPQQISSAEKKSVYFICQFIPRMTTLNKLFRMMLLQKNIVVYQATLMPFLLTEEEKKGLTEELRKCEQYLQRSRRQNDIGSPTIYEIRAEALCEGLGGQILRLQDAPFLLSISLAGKAPIPRSILESLGVEITAPVGTETTAFRNPVTGLQMGGYDIVTPSNNEERKIAKNVIQFLQINSWGNTMAPDALKRLRIIVDAYEASGAFRFPIATSEGLIGLIVNNVKMLPLPRALASIREKAKPEYSLYIGENRFLGISEDVILGEDDRRHHMYIIGQTGTGKTTLLKSMIIEDMHKGRGLAVIDPHGDLFEELLNYVPENRHDDVVILDPTDTEYPVGLNLLECSSPEERYYIAREMKAIIERLLQDQYTYQSTEYAGPVFYQHMQMNMLLAMSDPDNPGTLLEFHAIFMSDEYWKKWLPLKWKDIKLEAWVNNVLPHTKYTQKSGENMSYGEYLSSKFEDFVFDPKLRLIFGQKYSTIKLNEIMDKGKILLVNLAKVELSEANSRFLGMILMAKIYTAAMQRVALPQKKRRVFYLYVDEFQSLATQNFILLLSEARKFGLGLILANQFVSQIKDERITQSIFGNVGTLICFRVGQIDGNALEPHFLPFLDKYDLTNLPNWHAFVKTMAHGQVIPPFTLHTVLPQKERQSTINGSLIKDLSRIKYGRKRSEVEKEIKKSLSF